MQPCEWRFYLLGFERVFSVMHLCLFRGQDTYSLQKNPPNTMMRLQEIHQASEGDKEFQPNLPTIDSCVFSAVYLLQLYVLQPWALSGVFDLKWTNLHFTNLSCKVEKLPPGEFIILVIMKSLRFPVALITCMFFFLVLFSLPPGSSWLFISECFHAWWRDFDGVLVPPVLSAWC